MSARTRTIDTRHVLETAEGARLQLTVGGPIVRGLAWSIDLAIRSVLILALLMMLGSVATVGAIGQNDNASFLIGIALLVYFCSLLMASFRPRAMES